MKHTRQEMILRAIGAKTCSIADLARTLDVSHETIRRDLRALEATGKVHKLHGAVRLPDNAFETPFDERLHEQNDAKVRIAAATAQLIPEQSSLFIDSGTTSLHVARALRGHAQLSVVTNALDVARELSSINDNRVFLMGGEIDPDYRAVFDPGALTFAGRFLPDFAVLSMGAVDVEFGMMDFHLGESTIKQFFIPNARHVLVVADSTKFTRRGLIRTCGFSDVKTIVTEAPLPPEFTSALDHLSVVVADSDPV